MSFLLHNYNCILPFVGDIKLMLLHICSHGQKTVISRSVCETMYASDFYYSSQGHFDHVGYSMPVNLLADPKIYLVCL